MNVKDKKNHRKAEKFLSEKSYFKNTYIKFEICIRRILSRAVAIFWAL